MSGVNRHPRLPRERPEPERPSALMNAITLLVAVGMAVTLVLLLGLYVGAIGS